MAALEIVQLTEGTIVAGRYKVMKKLGEGGFGKLMVVVVFFSCSRRDISKFEKN